MMKKLIVAASAAAMLFTGAAASAQPAANAPAQSRDGRPTQAQMLARVDQHSAQIDTNRDGRLTQAELQTGRRDGRGQKAGTQRHGGRDGQQQAQNKRGKGDGQRAQNRGSRIERLDRNRDSAVTLAEFHAHAQERSPITTAGKAGLPTRMVAAKAA